MKKILLGAAILGIFLSSPALGEGVQPDPSEQLFRESLKSLFPLSESQTEQVRDRELDHQRAKQLPVPKGIRAKSRPLSLKPGADIQPLFLRPDYPTTIVFQDATGEPWPVNSVLPGNDEMVGVTYPEKGPGNLISMVARTFTGNVGLLVVLKPNIPVNLQLIIDGEAVPDQQITFRTDRPGPNAAPPEVNKNYPDTTDPILMDFLYGVPPSGAKRMEADHPQVEAYTFQDSLLIRSPFNVLWPGFQNVMKSGNGESTMYVFKMSKQPSIIIDTQNGEPVSVNIEGF